MGEILGLGLTHYPPLAGRDEDMALILGRVLEDPGLPPALRDPAAWPEPLRREYGADRGRAAAAAHRADLVAGFRRARRELDAFGPDLVVIWGDDQYENFRETVIPAFCVLAYGDLTMRPWAAGAWYRGRENIWGEGPETVVRIAGHPEAGRYLARGLLEAGVDVAYAYRPLHQEGLGHAFLNTVLFLDYDRVGFPYPVVSFAVNCYGRRVIAHQGGRRPLGAPVDPAALDPPSPSPARCMAVGAATARVLGASPWRVALVASSSWSHAFLVDRFHQLHPDHEADRRLHAALCRGDGAAWRATGLADLEAAGQQEVLNWFCLAGAMEALGRKPDECTLHETWAFNSNKCFAIWRP